MPDRPGIGARIARRMEKGPYQLFWRFGLRRTLAQTIDPPKAKIPLSVRPYTPSDEAALFDHRTTTDADDAREIRYRLDHIAADIPTPYVAVDETTGTPCYIQWLMGADQNARIQAKLWGFPRLSRTEALLENAYIPPAYRGQRIMPEAMYLIAEKARDIGATHALTFVTGDNMPSLKGCKRAGFDIYMVHERRDYAFGLFGRHSFFVLPQGDPRLALLDA
ncbi:MAG: GNAT family N-acetyltransferase [Rhodobacteraceae bacterium]|nr:GNAT family N-acetyltransferase [Paracoccaceae bacterium]